MRSVSLLEVAPLAADHVKPFEGHRPYLPTGGVGDGAELTPTAVTYADRPARADLCVQPGDVSFARMQGTKKILEFDEEDAGLILSTGFAVLRPKIVRLHPGYLRHWLSTDAFQFAKDRLCSGATQKAITNEKLELLTIPLPARVDEQQRITEILDEADVLRAKRRAAFAQLGTLTQSIFLTLFEDPNLPEPTIGDLLSSGALLLHKDGNHGSLYPRADDFGDDGVPFLSAKAVTEDGLIENTLVEKLREDKADTLKHGWISGGDVLLAHNASVGKVALYDGRFNRALIGTSLTAFRPNPVALDPRYLAAALRAPRFQRQLEKNMGQSTRNQVPITAQRALRIAQPSLPLQREFARRATTVEELKSTQRVSLTELDELFVSLQDRAFQGGL